ncbi:MAG: class II fructose-bisphosphate aldolase [Clostridia bacterium]|jgi:fructose-bisphosphate aldolase class II|nr:class II fructose-bisphosphate aldolase [Clostridia bacterium]
MYVSMKKMLADANANNYAVMAINCFNIETARTVIKAAEMEDAPIIVNIFQDHLVTHCDSELITPVVKTLAERSRVNVALNYDHGQDVDLLIKAIDDGFSSVMVDASRYEMDENIRITKEIADYAHSHGASVEGEIGCLGASEGGAFTQDAMYTDPEQAKIFFEKTNIDALAISIGTSHGNYPEGMVPKFDIDRLKEIKRLTHAPLVLHGGSGSGEENILLSVKNGINKINVGCDFMNANRDAIKKMLNENPEINYFDLIHGTEKESLELVRYYIGLSGSKGKNKNL